MLACVASYGDKDPRAINTLIANYKDAHDRFGMDVDVEVWVSDKKYATFRTEWPGIDVRVRVGDDSLGHDFAGLCRTSAKPHLHTDDYTHYLVSENDINVTSSNMEALCREHRHLDRTGRDDLHPMLVRYEDLVDTSGEFHRVVVDENYCNPPQVKKVEWHGGQRYVVPRNPYAAMFFLPVQRYRTYVDKLEKGIAMLRLEVRLFLVIFGYFWLFLVIFGYFWLSLVIFVWAIVLMDCFVHRTRRLTRGSSRTGPNTSRTALTGTPAGWSASGTPASGSKGSPPR